MEDFRIFIILIKTLVRNSTDMQTRDVKCHLFVHCHVSSSIYLFIYLFIYFTLLYFGFILLYFTLSILQIFYIMRI